MPGDINENSKDDVISNGDFTCSYVSFLNKIINLASTADNATLTQTLPYESSQAIGSQVRNWPGSKRMNRENKENHSLVMRGRRSRKQSRPMRLIWNQEAMGNGKMRTIPSLGRLEAIAQNISPRVTQDVAEDISQQQNDNVQNIALDVSRDISRDIADDISPDTSQQQQNDNVQNMVQDVSRDISRDIAENISLDTSQRQRKNEIGNVALNPILHDISQNITISNTRRDKKSLLNKKRRNKRIGSICQRYQQKMKSREKIFRCILCWKNKGPCRVFSMKSTLLVHKLIYHGKSRKSIK